MTRDRARKQAIRIRMAGSDEPYSVAARRLAAAEPDPMEPDAAAVTACVARTLAAPSARISSHLDLELPGTTEADRQRARGLRGLARRGLGQLFNLFLHPTREGFAEPAAQRYMVADRSRHQAADRSRAEVFADGRLYRGPAGRLLTAITPWQPGDGADVDHNVFWSLWALAGTTSASFDGTETVRDSLCRRYLVHTDLAQADLVRADLVRAAAGGQASVGDWPVSFVQDPRPPHPPSFTVWTDGQHVRRVRFAKQDGNDISPDLNGYGSLIHLELWDFGVPVAHLDWSRLPDFTASA